jgi:hypothetical protein
MPNEDPMEPIRVKDKDTGYISTIRRVSLPHGNYQELKQAAVDPLTGEFLPTEFPSSADTSGSAATPKESTS